MNRRDLFRNAAIVAGLLIPRRRLLANSPLDTDEARLAAWASTLRRESPSMGTRPFGARAARVGELAVGTPYEAFTLEAYIKAGGNPAGLEPLALSLTRFDCVTLVESCLAVTRVAGSPGTPSWKRFAHEIERMRYRGGKREGYASRRDEGGVLRVLHAPLSGGAVEITRTTLPEYVSAIRRATGILVARPLPG